MPMGALQHRRSGKTESTLNFGNPQGQPHSTSTIPPQHLCSDLGSAYGQINVSDAQEDPAQPIHGLQQQPSVPSPTGATQIGPYHQTSNDGRDSDIKKSTTPMEDEGKNSRNARETEILNLYEEFRRLSAKRVRVRQSRMALKYQREDEMELRVKFMRRLNSFFANLDHPSAEPLRMEYELLQVATEEYLRLENSYRQEEDQLEEQEYELSLSMEGFTGSTDRGPTPAVQNYTLPETAGMDEDEEASIRKTPPCATTYLTRVGDERILQERLAELESEWYIAIERQAQRHQLSIPLDEDSEEFLLTFDRQWANVWKELNNAQLDVNSLHMICLEQGYSGFDHEDLFSLNLYQYEATRELDPDPLNLPAQEQSIFVAKANFTGEDNYDPPGPNWNNGKGSPMRQLQQGGSSMNSIEYINKWMLHQLRVSSVGIWRLQRSPFWQPLRDQGWHNHEISQAILDSWFSDEAALASSSYNPYLNEDDDDEDTIIGHGNRRRPRGNLKAPSSMPSSPRSSAPKLAMLRRLSEP
ncbi:hypothetical protein BJX76DRAFT_182168 [Aspergillus varians]